MRALNTKLLGHLIQTATPNATWKAAVAVQVRALHTAKSNGSVCPRRFAFTCNGCGGVQWILCGLSQASSHGLWSFIEGKKKFASSATRSCGFKSVWPVCDEALIIIMSSGVAASLLRIVLALCA